MMNPAQWTGYLGSKIKNQLAAETVERIHLWALSLLGLAALGLALGPIGSLDERSFFGMQAFFLIFFHAVMLLGYYGPGRLAGKNSRWLMRALEIRDFISLVFVFVALVFYAAILLRVGYQAAVRGADMEVSAWGAVLGWLNFVFILFYALLAVSACAAFNFAPHLLVRFMDRSGRMPLVLMSIHLGLGLLLFADYAARTGFGSPLFFEEFRLAGMFWIFIAASIFVTGRLLAESALPALNALEFEVATGHWTRPEDILLRFKAAFASVRFDTWLNTLARSAAEKSHEIARCLHEAVRLIGQEKPTELELKQVEDCYRRAEAVIRKLDREGQRFLAVLSFLDLQEACLGKSEELRDQFLRDLRNARLELAGVRKCIDEKLIALKDRAAAASPASSNPSLITQGAGSLKD